MLIQEYEILKTEFYKEQNNEKIKKYGQFFTPKEIAKFMVKYIPKKEGLKILDPAFGLGIFSIYLKEFYSKNIHSIIGYEIDINLKKYIEKLFKNESVVKVFYTDYLKDQWNEKFDFIIANPPYYKHHFINDKSFLIKKFEQKMNIKLSKTTNVYILFLLKSIYQLNENGKLIYIIPSEFLNSNYGEKVKEYLISHNFLEQIIKFDFNINVFDDAITTSCILIINKKKKNKDVLFYNIQSINEILKIEKIKPYKYNIENLDPNKKWNVYFKNSLNLNKKNLIRFSEIARVKRGIATGSNKYFTFSKSKQKKYKISNEALIPCICKASQLKDTKVLTLELLNNLINNDEKVLLFNGLNKQTSYDEKYILLGEKQGINKKYLTSKRNPWYRLEQRKPADLLVGVFHRRELRFILNETNALNLTCFHGVYINETFNFSKKLIFLYLECHVSKELFYFEKRDFGNGLSKFEPNDLNNSYILDFSKLKEKDLKALNQLAKKYYDNILKSNFLNPDNIKILQEADKIFRSYIFK